MRQSVKLEKGTSLDEVLSKEKESSVMMWKAVSRNPAFGVELRTEPLNTREGDSITLGKEVSQREENVLRGVFGNVLCGSGGPGRVL